jgi:CheY-like chemotaxis protein
MFARMSRPTSPAEGGLGIGLALARRLATMHGGSLSAFSEGEGRGSTLTLTLPLASRPERKSSKPASGDGKEVDSRPLNVLVIEDNEDVADSLVDWLESTGHRVSVARKGEVGVDMARRTRPNVVLCDLGLPGMDGFEVCRSIRAMAPEVNPVMIALTGWGREEDLLRTREAGFDHHLIKPVAGERLDAVLRQITK